MHVVEYEIHSASALEDELHIDYERMVDLKHNESFKVDAFNRVLIKNHIFSDAFECVILLTRR